MAVKKSPSKTTAKKPVRKSTKKPVKKSSPISRELWGCAFIALAVLTIFSLLNFEGFVTEAYYKSVTFFIGFGIYILPVSLIALGILCFINFKGNTSLRSFAILSMPIILSCFIQVILFGGEYSLNFEDIQLIIDEGLEANSAGLLGGFISIILESSLSSIGAIIFLSLANIFVLFVSFNLTPAKVYSVISEYFNDLSYDEEEDEDYEYKLSKRDMKQASKEKQKEHNEKLKVAKQQAISTYKNDVEVKTPKKYRGFNIDIPLSYQNESEQNLTKEEISEVRPKADAWIIEEYERIKARNEIERQQKLDARKALEDSNPSSDLEKIDYVMTDLSEIEILDTPNSFDTFNNELARDVASEIEQILDNPDVELTKTGVSAIEIPMIYANSETTDIPIVPERDFPTIDVYGDIKNEIAEAIDEITLNYKYIKAEIIPDELKSTMRYETISDFNPEDLTYNYSFPSFELLTQKLLSSEFDPTIELKDSSDRLIDTLDSFGIAAKIIHIVRGPSITRFEITISKGIKFSKLTSLSDDIALALGSANVRIAAIPDKVAIGIEVPNKTTEMVLIKEVLDSPEFINTVSKLSYALGKDITGKPFIGDIAKMPHMLIAGTTGSGKSVCVNSMLVSLLYKADPEQVKFIMIDPKMVELGGYNGIPHLLIPVVTDPKKAAGALNWAVGEMMKRYKMFAESNVKDLVSYNISVAKKISEGDLEIRPLPQIVIVIDELADLMMIAAKEVEESICRIAQMARAAGMHLVIATQRPSSDVITGIMKANIPSRISFAVSSQIESRIILDSTGAEKLIGKGDMLYNPLGVSKPIRLQGCFITASEIEAVVDYVKTIAQPDYNDEVLAHIESHSSKDGGSSSSSNDTSADEDDALIEDAIDVIVSTGQASTSFLQRKLKLGYSRASRIIDQIEDRGIIGTFEGSKPRQILITKQQWQ